MIINFDTMSDMLRGYFEKQLQKKLARGIIIIDKESGLTSHDEVDRLRGIFCTRKIGHSGTLDPKVTGVLVCGLGQGTRVLEYVLLSRKVYECEIVFHAVVEPRDFYRVVKDFRGTIVQKPPVRSRVKRVEREREIYEIEVLDFAENKRSAVMRCGVERGTYIRKLCHDMGLRLGRGAHMGELRRIQAGPFSLNNSRLVRTGQLEQMKDRSSSGWIGWWWIWKMSRYIEPIERVLEGTPRVRVDIRMREVIRAGANVFIPGVLEADFCESGDMVQVVDSRGILLAVGYADCSSAQMQQNSKGIAVVVSKVLSPR